MACCPCAYHDALFAFPGIGVLEVDGVHVCAGEGFFVGKSRHD